MFVYARDMTVILPPLVQAARPLPPRYWGRRNWRKRVRFTVSQLVATLWMILSIWLSLPWLSDLADLSDRTVALVVLTFIAFAPGFMNAFLLTSLAMRPDSIRLTPKTWPAITILIAAFEEERLIAETLRDISKLDYPGVIEVLVMDDGSKDCTPKVVIECQACFATLPHINLRLVREEVNRGKARVLNLGLVEAAHELIVTIDADTRLQPDCLTAMVERLTASPPETAAIAGSVLVANPRDSWITAAQQWDYFHGIAAVKRLQGMYDGTLVAQGAFSIYRRDALIHVGGWPETVGEDIVLTWALLRRGYAIGHAEDAIAWTYAPTTLEGLIRQRKRWARGMIEALTIHKRLLLSPRLSTMFIWWNLLFVSIDLAFTVAFIPGLILALFGIYWLAGPVTLLLLPIAALWNLLIYRIQSRLLKRHGINMHKNGPGFLVYAFIYPVLLQPVSVWGYFAEFLGGRKQWS